MKSKLVRLAGWGALLAAFAILVSVSGSTPARGQSPTVNAPPPVQAAPVAPAAPPPAPYIVCGVCGARIQQPQQVLVAAPYYSGQPVVAYDSCSAREYIPAAPVFSLTDYGRADPRYIRPTCYEQPVYSYGRRIR